MSYAFHMPSYQYGNEVKATASTQFMLLGNMLQTELMTASERRVQAIIQRSWINRRCLLDRWCLFYIEKNKHPWPSFASDKDQIRQKRVESSLSLATHYFNYHFGYQRQWWVSIAAMRHLQSQTEGYINTVTQLSGSPPPSSQPVKSSAITALSSNNSNNYYSITNDISQRSFFLVYNKEGY